MIIYIISTYLTVACKIVRVNVQTSYGPIRNAYNIICATDLLPKDNSKIITHSMDGDI